jgi:hypothetical protein
VTKDRQPAHGYTDGLKASRRLDGKIQNAGQNYPTTIIVYTISPKKESALIALGRKKTGDLLASG